MKSSRHPSKCKKKNIGSLVKIIDDPNSFIVGEDLVDKVGLVVAFDVATEVFTVLLQDGRKIKSLNFLLELIEE